MEKRLRALATTGFLALAAVSEARAFERNATVTGPRGISFVHAQGGCGGASCFRGIARTASSGGTVTRQDGISR